MYVYWTIYSIVSTEQLQLFFPYIEILIYRETALQHKKTQQYKHKYKQNESSDQAYHK